ncbi:MAG: chemotaxis protein CheX [Thermodesulfobacteriota bacterium]|nr:chemotaxis protein CheX [Thermodesulfobacteriota bacterium]
MKYAQDIADATQEIFSSMVMLEVTPGEPLKRADNKLVDSISGIIGLAGTIKGMLAIHLPNQAALAITTAFLGMDVDEIDEDVCDAIGELANMLGGSMKTILDPGGSNVQLSMPSAIHGEEYAVDCLADAELVTVPFSFNGQTFMVELQISETN